MRNATAEKFLIFELVRYYISPSHPSVLSVPPLSAGPGPTGVSARIRPKIASARIGMGLGRTELD
jgi:hypothetical protein